MAEEESSKNAYFFKVCVTGEWGVGKSTTIVRYTEGKFDPDIPKTSEFEFKIKIFEYNGKNIKMRVCDSVGEERFSALTASFFRGAHAVIFLYDVTNIESAENLKRWYTEVNRYVEADTLPKAIAANKVDLEDQPQHQQNVAETTKIAEKLSKEWECPLVKCSAKTGANMDKLFESLLPAAMAKADSLAASQSSGSLRPQTKSSNNTEPVVITPPKKKGGCMIL